MSSYVFSTTSSDGHDTLGASKIVAIKVNKVSCTSSILTSMEKPHLLQMIWEGKTDTVHANRGEKDCPNTAKVRKDNGFPVDQPACLILDAAPQHGNCIEILKENNIHLIV